MVSVSLISCVCLSFGLNDIYSLCRIIDISMNCDLVITGCAGLKCYNCISAKLSCINRKCKFYCSVSCCRRCKCLLSNSACFRTVRFLDQLTAHSVLGIRLEVLILYHILDDYIRLCSCLLIAVSSISCSCLNLGLLNLYGLSLVIYICVNNNICLSVFNCLKCY